MEHVSGVSLPVFLGLTVVLMGAAGYMTGQSSAANWRPVWHLLLYCILLGAADRFLTFVLFGGNFLSPAGYLLDTAVITAVGLIGYWLTRVKKMVTQYPWIFERVGPLRYRARVGRTEEKGE